MEIIKSKLQSLNLALTRVIEKWKRSGNGFGQQQDSEGSSDDDSTPSVPDYNNRATFFKNSELYLLYYWIVMDNAGLLQSCVQKLDKSIGSADGGAGVPTSVAKRRAGSYKSSVSSNDLQGSIFEASVKNVEAATLMAIEYQKDREERERERQQRQLEIENERQQRQFEIEKERRFKGMESLKRNIHKLYGQQIEAETEAARAMFLQPPNECMANFFRDKAVKIAERSNGFKDELKELERSS